MYQAKEWGLPEEMTLQETALLDTFIPLSWLTHSFPANADAARVAYAQSLSLVTYIINEHGKDAFHRLIKNLREGVGPETALRRATGVELDTLERNWQSALREKYSWISVIASTTVLWGVITAIFFGAYLYKKKRTKAIEAIWEEEDSLSFASRPWSVVENRRDLQDKNLANPVNPVYSHSQTTNNEQRTTDL